MKANPLGTERFHVTLHHLGDYAGLLQRVVAEATRIAATVAMPQFEVAFDRALSLHGKRGSRPLVLRGGDGLVALEAFQRGLVAALYKAEVAGGTARSRYTPHATPPVDAGMLARSHRSVWTAAAGMNFRISRTMLKLNSLLTLVATAEVGSISEAGAAPADI